MFQRMRGRAAASVSVALLIQLVGGPAIASVAATAPSSAGRVSVVHPVQKTGTPKDELKLRAAGRIPGAQRVISGPSAPAPNTVVGPNLLLNNNNGASSSAYFTQSETNTLAFGTNVVTAYNDSGSYAGGASYHFTGWSYSSDSGATWTDGGILPTSAIGDAGDPVLARDSVSGRIYLSTLGLNNSNAILVFHSDDNGVTWSNPVNAAPVGEQDKPWIAVDNTAGSGQGNLYLVSRDFGAGNGIYLFRSTDQGATFGSGVLIASGASGNVQGAYVAVGTDHAVYVFYYDSNGSVLRVKKSTDQGATFGSAVQVATGISTSLNGDLGLTGVRQGTVSASSFRSNGFPSVAVNPANGDLFVAYNVPGSGGDKGDIKLVQSQDGGATWGSPVSVNDDGTSTDQWMPNIVVSPDGSRLGVFYYSRQVDTVNDNLFRYYGRIAVVSGHTLTWDPSFAVSDTNSLPEFGRDNVVNSVYMGDYDHASATSSAFDVTWSDNRDDLAGGASSQKDPNVYFASISLGLEVASTDPAADAVVASIPTDYVINLTAPVDTATVDASDLTVDGVAADSFGLSNGNATITFHYNSDPFTTQGQHTLHIAADAFERASDSSPVSEYTGHFRYDTVGLAVTSTDPADGGSFTTGTGRTLDVNFNEAVDPATVDTSDLALSGTAGASVTAVSVINGGQTAEFTLDVPNEGTIDGSIGKNDITDVYGNPGTDFSATWYGDNADGGYPTPLDSLSPAGSLIYDPTASGLISPVGDTDAFTLNVDAGQTITLVVTPGAGLDPTVTLQDPSSTVIASATGAAAGQAAVANTVPATTAGTYTITVSGASSTSGSYTLRAILNASQEVEGILFGVHDDSLATAQSIDSSFVALTATNGSGQRGAVLGGGDPTTYTATAVPYGFEDITSTGSAIGALHSQDDAYADVTIPFSFPFYGSSYTDVNVATNGLLTFGSGNAEFTNADMTTDPTQAAIAPLWDDLSLVGTGDVYLQDIGSGAGEHLDIQWNNVKFFNSTGGGTITFEAQLYADGRIVFNYQDLAGSGAGHDEGASATVGIKDAGSQGANRLELAFNDGPNAYVGTGQSTEIDPPGTGVDYYAMTLAAGDVVTLAATGDGTLVPSVDLRDGSDTVLATGVAGATNVDSVISSYVVVSSGTYYARVSAGGTGEYTLVVTKNAAFDTEANDPAGSAQAIGGNHGALGAVGGSEADWYSVTLGATNNTLSADTITPGDGPGEPANTLDPRIQLYDSTGTTLIATGTAKGDGRNESLTATGLTGGGTYLVKVTADAGSGEYFLGVAVSGTIVTGPTSQITRSGATCTQVASGTAATLANLSYSVKKGKINQISQGEFDYWVRVSASSGANSFTVTQAIMSGNFSKLFTLSGGAVYGAGCVSVASPTFTYNPADGSVAVQFSAASSGDDYVMVRYRTLAIKGQTPPSPTTITYQFSTTGVSDSTQSIGVVRK